ncbi:hypothetical protein [Novosphingobium mangrovi (ex Huang et al. 2023)]|uniref:Lipoprotein n=1 Tax=Novosphingobium mangrovi (ex Huang et al. 2023) TaxID=2976432 RepID=A0ABT2I2P5_9SPHN|nr:hypothetical protein [Novosphingobium mangrovi (ex Huang et al. 2023)]MCT2399075.1 hypothetical protein [Novosphingobium mangrovi (ex Huang et al. 2023)]
MIAALLLASATSFDPWLIFDRSPAREHSSETIEVGTLHDDEDFSYEFRRTVRNEHGEVVYWTDTRRCPQALDVLISAEKLESPAVSIPFLLGKDLIVTADGTGYHLKADAQYPEHGLGTIEFNSNSGTPLAQWVDDSLARLEPCWKANRMSR